MSASDVGHASPTVSDCGCETAPRALSLHLSVCKSSAEVSSRGAESPQRTSGTVTASAGTARRGSFKMARQFMEADSVLVH